MTLSLIFGKLVLPMNEIPGFVPDSTARHWRALLFLGFVSPQKLIDGAPNQFDARGEPDAKFREFQRNALHLRHSDGV